MQNITKNIAPNAIGLDTVGMFEYRCAWHSGGAFFLTLKLLRRRGNDLLILHTQPMFRSLFFFAFLFTTWSALAQGLLPISAAIATSHPLATAAGEEILKQGGNAFDAAVAVGATLAVVEPYGSGLGGGGFWLLHRARDGFETMVDGRETAPGKATRDMYLDATGKPMERASLYGPKAAGIPGTPAALVHLARKFGKLPLKTSLAPAIRYASAGFAVDGRYLSNVGSRVKLLREYPLAAGIFLDQGEAPQSGWILQQPALAVTLKAIAENGAAGFYEGLVARELVASVTAGGGIWSEKDLKRYRVVERKPLKFTYRGATITSAPPPSSGGATLAQAMNILERLPYEGATPAQRMHLAVEAMRRAYQDRGRYLGDPDFVKMPFQRLASKQYATQRAATIDPDWATPSGLMPEEKEGRNTTHFSIVDGEGNRVAATLSINTFFGSGFVAGKTGVLLNNEMDDFATVPGKPNVYGLVQGEANAIAPGKRPLSSMSPTFVEDQRGVLVLGTPGGSRIISMVLLGILDYMHQSVPDVARIVGLPRFHHQFQPDRVEVEPGAFAPEIIKELELKGHIIQPASRQWGNMQAVFVDKRSGWIQAWSDPRGEQR